MERNGTVRNVARAEKSGVDSAYFFSSAKGFRQGGNSPPHNPPKGGCVGGERHSPQPALSAEREARAEWVRQNLPGCAAVAAAFRAEFEGVRMVWAREGWNEVGKATE